MSWFWVTAIGRDRPGIVVELATALAEQGGNIEDASMSRFKNWFAVMVLVAFDGDPDLQGSLGGVARRMDLTLDVRPVPAEDRMNAGSGTPTHRVSVYGADAPGIVATVARRLRDRGANVVDLSTDVARPAETAGAASKPEDGALDDVPGEESGGAAAGTSATPPGALFVMVMDVETDPLLGKDDPLAGLAGELAEELSMEVHIVPLEGVIL